MKLRRIKPTKITPIWVEWNDMNGLIIDVLGIETNWWEGSLFGVGFGSRDYFTLHFLYFNFEIW